MNPQNEEQTPEVKIFPKEQPRAFADYQSRPLSVPYQPTTGVETIMPYEMALDYEQEQRLEQGKLAEECRQAETLYRKSA